MSRDEVEQRAVRYLQDLVTKAEEHLAALTSGQSSAPQRAGAAARELWRQAELVGVAFIKVGLLSRDKVRNVVKPLTDAMRKEGLLKE